MKYLERDAEVQERKLAIDRFVAFGGAALVLSGAYIDSVPAVVAGSVIAVAGAIKSTLDA